MFRSNIILYKKSLKLQSINRCISRAKSNICNVSLSQALPELDDVDESKFNGSSASTPPLTRDVDTFNTRVTTLDNGLRVASQNHFGQYSTVGVLIDSGSRYETSYPAGISHFMEKLAFSSTENYSNRDAILQNLEKHGGICDCQGSRDTLIYAVSALSSGVDEVVKLLSDVSLKPSISDQEIEESRLAIKFDLDTIDMSPDPEQLLVELIHKAAFSSNTLGNPKLCLPESIKLIDRDVMYDYMKMYHVPERMVLAAVGVDHNVLVQQAQKYFTGKPIWNDRTSKSPQSLLGVDKSLAQYTGGIVKVDKDLSNVSLGPNPMPDLAHVVIGMQSCSHKHEDFVAFCVLNMLLGGGGSFSAGGPGKGMYSRLYLNVLNQYHWMHNATAYNHSYNDNGLFCINASSNPADLQSVVEVIVREFVSIKGTITEIELSRAKTQLQSMLLMNLESRPVVFEDIGRQVLANGLRLPSIHYFDEIAKITVDDIERVVTSMLATPVSVAALGDLGKLPTLDSIQNALRTPPPTPPAAESNRTKKYASFMKKFKG